MTDSDLEGMTITQLAPQIKSRKVSPVELTEVFLRRISRLNPTLVAYTTVTEESARAQAKAAESDIGRGNYLGPLHGIPISVKENICIKGVRTTAGSKTLAEWVPGQDSIRSMAPRAIPGTPLELPRVPAAARARLWPRACAWLRSEPTTAVP
jgi:Asp-tRNA(Asn)/Glu-tRNA(Gln) amidotransferase A subunit family amidase